MGFQPVDFVFFSEILPLLCYQQKINPGLKLFTFFQ